MLAQPRVNTYLLPSRHDAKAIRRLIASAKADLKVCVFQYSDNGIHKILLQLASSGVRVTLITSYQIFRKKQHSPLSVKMRSLLFQLLVKFPMQVL